MATKPEATKGAKTSGKIKVFFRGVWSELKKVHWPDRKQIVIYTGVVVVFVFVVSLAVSALDWLFTNVLHLVLG